MFDPYIDFLWCYVGQKGFKPCTDSQGPGHHVQPQSDLPASVAKSDAHPIGDQEVVGLTPAGPTSVAQLDVRLTGDQEVAALTPAEVGNILLWRFDPEIYSMVILSLPLIQRRAVVSFWRKNVHNTG